MTTNEIKQKLKEAMDLCLKEKIIGVCTSIEGYYVKFKFSQIKQKCDKCGQDIE